MTDKLTDLIPDHFYHIYNRANGNEQLFLSDQNYGYFLLRYAEFINPIAKTYSYCLMPNHFHFLIQIRDEKEYNPDLTGFENLSGLYSQKFSNFFNAYTKAFNKQQNRKGSLFIRPFKRKRIINQTYLTNLIQYINLNPVEAGIVSLAEDWKYSSYSALISSKNTLVERAQVLEWFGGLDNFKHIHEHGAKLQFDDLGF
jgi:putative transposase